MLEENIFCWIQDLGIGEAAQLCAPGSSQQLGWRCILSRQMHTEHMYTPCAYLYTYPDTRIRQTPRVLT